MGTDASSADEWIELKNTTDGEIDLTGWTLKAIDGTPEITLEGIIAASGYFLIERTNDESVPGISADQVYTGALGNAGEKLELRDTGESLTDSIDCSSEWLAGDNETKQTMEKISSGWQTSLEPGGTPRAQNSSGGETPIEEPSEEPSAEQPSSSSAPSASTSQSPIAHAGFDMTALVNQEISFDGSLSADPNNDTLTFFWNFGDGATETEEKTTHTYTHPGQYLVSLMVSDGEFSDLDIIAVNIYSQSVIISEFVPDPEGKDEDFEWIELYNQSDQIANLSNWQLDDQGGGSSPFIFPANSLIAPKQFLVLKSPITKISLNNDNDQVRLFYPDGSLATEVSYLAEEKEGFCVAFDGLDYLWTKVPTPGGANIISSSNIGNETKEVLSNNPEPIIEQSQEAPEVLARIDLDQSQDYSVSNPSITQSAPKEEKNIFFQQSAALAQTSQSNLRGNLILILSIIISSALLFGWILVLIRNKARTH